jgi:hypothetical protein
MTGLYPIQSQRREYRVITEHTPTHGIARMSLGQPRMQLSLATVYPVSSAQDATRSICSSWAWEAGVSGTAIGSGGGQRRHDHMASVSMARYPRHPRRQRADRPNPRMGPNHRCRARGLAMRPFCGRVSLGTGTGIHLRCLGEPWTTCPLTVRQRFQGSATLVAKPR